ncbi:MAG: GHKL domain-containing protein [Acetatifactor sp.]|nr:GHKL domain-containing protein [Acetatifactor sp.]
MFYYVENLLIVVFEVFCCKFFFETFGAKRSIGKRSLELFQLVLLCFFADLFAEVLANHFVVRQLANFIVISLIMYWRMKIGYKKSVVLTFLYIAVMLTMDYIAYIINSNWFKNDIIISEYYVLEGHLVSLLGKVILFISILFIRKLFSKRKTEMLVDTEWLKFLFFPVFTIAMIAAMLTYFKYIETFQQAIVLYTIAISTAGMNIVVYYLINDILKRETQIYEDRIFKMQVKNQVDMYRTISENYDKQKRKTHEYKNQIVCIESLLIKKRYWELEKYVKSIYGDLNEETEVINTNNVIVNAVLNSKYQEMIGKGILFVFRVNDLAEICISDEDVVTILSNLLNNAIEACEKCDERKIIRLKFIREDSKIIIAVKNTFNQPIHYEDGEIKTSKLLDSEEHGVGIKNVERIIEKYGGIHVKKEMEKEFLFSIIIPLAHHKGTL